MLLNAVYASCCLCTYVFILNNLLTDDSLMLTSPCSINWFNSWSFSFSLFALFPVDFDAVLIDSVRSIYGKDWGSRIYGMINKRRRRVGSREKRGNEREGRRNIDGSRERRRRREEKRGDERGGRRNIDGREEKRGEGEEKLNGDQLMIELCAHMHIGWINECQCVNVVNIILLQHDDANRDTDVNQYHLVTIYPIAILLLVLRSNGNEWT